MKRVKYRPLCIIESPYSGDVETNLAYLSLCIADSIKRGETPYASHQMIAAASALDDSDPEERQLGIDCGLALYPYARSVAFYVELGWSRGMKAALEYAVQRNAACESARIEIEFRAVMPGSPEFQVGYDEGTALLDSLFGGVL